MIDYCDLSMRLIARNPFGHTCGVFFRFKEHEIRSYSGLIDFVLDRYSRRFGFVDPEKAESLQLRLAKKYSGNPDSTMRSLKGFDKRVNVYPRSKALTLARHYMALDALEHKYKNPDAPYCEISNIYKVTLCPICGKPTYYNTGKFRVEVG